MSLGQLPPVTYRIESILMGIRLSQWLTYYGYATARARCAIEARETMHEQNGLRCRNFVQQ